MRRIVVFGYGLVVYLTFLAVFMALELFVANLGIVRGIDDGGTGSFVVDLGLIAVFGITHSVLARPWFKQRLTRVIPEAAERSTYVLVANATLALLIWQWRALPAVVWEIESQPARWLVWLVHGGGALLIVVATFLTDHFDLFGLRQTWLYARGVPYTPVPFVERSLYTRVRHPMMLGVLVWIWAAPTMTVGHLVFAAGMTGYVALGIALEERGLSRTLGTAYDDYRRRVRALVPVRRRE